MASQGSQMPSFPETQGINLANDEEKRLNLMLSKLYPSPAADAQHKIFPQKLYPDMPSELMEKKRRYVHQKHFQLEPLTGSRSDQSSCTQQLQTSSNRVNLLQGTPSGLCGNPADLPTIYGPTQPVTPTFPENLWQLYLSQSPFPISKLKCPPSVLNSAVHNLPPIPTLKTEAPITTQRFYDPTQAAEISRNLGYKPPQNTFLPLRELSGFRFFENSWWPVRKSVKPLPQRPSFYCRDCKTIFEATILKKSNNGAVQHRCSFVGRPITRRVGIRSKVCKGSHPGACIIPLGELTGDEKAVSNTSKENLVPVFCHNVEDLTYVKRYARHPPLCRIRVWCLTENTKQGSRSIEYYDCQCNQLFPPVANIEVAKKHACQHDETKNCCDIRGKWFSHHSQVNAHKKIHKVHQNKISKRDRFLYGTLPCELDPRESVGLKRQKTHHDETLRKRERILTPSKPITLPPQIFHNSRFVMERVNQNSESTPVIPNGAIPGPVLPQLRVPNFDVPGAERSSPSGYL